MRHYSFACALVLGSLSSVRTQQQFADLSTTLLPPDSDTTFTVAHGDLDGDGDEDLIWGDLDGARVYINDGTARFASVPSGLPGGPLIPILAVRVGDVDGDQDLDLLLLGASTPSLYVNNGSAWFGVHTSALPQAPALDAAFIDADADKDLDLLVSGSAGLKLWLNDGTGRFQDGTAGRLPSTTSYPYTLVVGLIDKNPLQDFVVTDGRALRLFLNAGRGVFVDRTATHLPAHRDQTRALALGDVDADGDTDLFVGNYYSADRLYLNDGTARFADASAQLPMPPRALTDGASLADFDEDDDLDLFVSKSPLGALPERQRLYLNDGKGSFADVSVQRLPQLQPGYLGTTVADLDRDGDVDIAVAHPATRNVLLLNRLRDTRASKPPRIGQPLNVEIHARAGFATGPQTAVPFLGLSEARPRLVIPPFGSLGVGLTGLLVWLPIPLPAPSGTASFQLPVPNLRALVGQTLRAQSLVLYAANPATWRFSNLFRVAIQP